MVGGFVCKKGKQEGSFWKKGYKGCGSIVNRGKVGGFWAKALLLPLPTLENRGGGSAPAVAEEGGTRRRAAATVVAVLQGSAAARSWEKRGREPRGFYPLPWFGLGRSEVSGPQEPVAAAEELLAAALQS